MDEDKARVAFYASTYLDKEYDIAVTDQFRAHFNSLEHQEYTLAGYYSDERNIASNERRHGVMQLLKDARDGKIDWVLTYNAERLALNHNNLVEIVRRLKLSGVEVYSQIGASEPLSVQLADDIYTAEQEAIYKEAMAWESYWDEQMEIAEQDYPQSDFNEAAHGHMPTQSLQASSTLQVQSQDNRPEV